MVILAILPQKKIDLGGSGPVRLTCTILPTSSNLAMHAKLLNKNRQNFLWENQQPVPSFPHIILSPDPTL